MDRFTTPVAKALPDPNGEYVRYSDVERVRHELVRRADQAIEPETYRELRAVADLLTQPNPDLPVEGEAGQAALKRAAGKCDEDIAAHEGMIRESKSGSLAEEIKRHSTICIGIYRKVADRLDGGDRLEQAAAKVPPISDEASQRAAAYARKQGWGQPAPSTQPSSNPGEGERT